MKLKIYKVSSWFFGVLCVFLIFPSHQHASWTSGGPYGGYVNCIAIAQSNPDVIFAGTVRGVFITVNGGASWSHKGLSDDEIRSIQISPYDANTIYVGTFRNGIYKSENAGTTWSPKGIEGQTVNTIAIDSDNSDIIYAGTGEWESVLDNEIAGIFKSIDAGDTWQNKLPEGQSEVTALLIDSDNSSYIYAGVDPYAGHPHYKEDGLLKSIDGGDTWESIHVSNDTINDSQVTSLAMSPTGPDPSVIYANCPTTLEPGLYRSTDKGETWNLLTPSSSEFHSPKMSVSVDPNNHQIIYFGEYKSTDGGNNWTEKSSGLPLTAFTPIKIDPRNSSVLYVGSSEGGVFKSTDGADLWSRSSKGMIGTYVLDLEVDPFSSDRVIAAIDGEFYLAKTINGGKSWIYLDSDGAPIDPGAVAIDPIVTSTIWAGDRHHWDYEWYVYRSNDSGQTWESPIICARGSGTTGTSDFLVKADDSKSLLVSFGRNKWTGGLFLSLNQGDGWENSSNDRATVLADDPNYPNIVYYGKSDMAYVYRSPNFGAPNTWTMISPSGNDWGVHSLNDLEVDLNSHVYAATNQGLMKWEGNGFEWKKLSGLPTENIMAVAIDHSESPETLYVGTGENGAYISKDKGITWTAFNQGLGNISITSLFLGGGQSKILYAGTAYGGVWSRKLSRSSALPCLPLMLLFY